VHDLMLRRGCERLVGPELPGVAFGIARAVLARVAEIARLGDDLGTGRPGGRDEPTITIPLPKRSSACATEPSSPAWNACRSAPNARSRNSIAACASS